MKTWDFLQEFAVALESHLINDDTKWGDTWLKRTKKGQDERMIMSTKDRFDRFENGGQPIDYLAIAGDAFINWIRENHPELWKE